MLGQRDDHLEEDGVECSLSTPDTSITHVKVQQRLNVLKKKPSSDKKKFRKWIAVTVVQQYECT